MAAPVERSQLVARFVVEVETSPGSGQFAVDERLRAEQVELGSDERIGSARISVRLDAGFGPMQALRRYHPDLRLIVRTDHVDPSRREVLFEGYPPVQQSRWDAWSEAFAFQAEHVYERLVRTRSAQVLGRYVRTGQIEDGLAADPESWADKSALVTALPCVFNFDGRGNCSPTPLTVQSASGQTRSIYIFTHDDDPEAITWTFANALRYLVWFYALGEGLVFEGNVFSATDALADEEPDGRAYAGRSDALARALLRRCESLNCEATNVVEALGLLADAAGVHITPETVCQEGRIRTQLRVWAASGGPLRWLNLGAGGVDADGRRNYRAAGKPVRRILEDNQVHRASLAWERGGLVHCPIVVGGVKCYEMTVPLVPGWLPRSGLDNVPSEQREAAKALALTPEQVEALGEAVREHDWFKKYHRQGSEYKYNAHIARRWVLNEDGRYEPALYNRNWPFDDYKPFDFSSVADATVTQGGAWMRRARRFRPTITRTTEGHRAGVLVEVSFDGGSTWHVQSSGVRVLKDECGIFFDCDNPTEIAPPATAPAEQNMWYAIIDQTFRVRVTAVIEADERLCCEWRPVRAGAGTTRLSCRIVYRPDVFAFVSREHTTNVLADVNPAAGDMGRDDTAAMEALAEQMALSLSDRRIRGVLAIPWIETDYAIGDRIAGIRGQGIDFGVPPDEPQWYPAVVGKRYRLDDGRYETELILDNRGLGG